MSVVIFYQGKPLDLNNTLLVLVLQGIAQKLSKHTFLCWLFMYGNFNDGNLSFAKIFQILFQIINLYLTNFDPYTINNEDFVRNANVKENILLTLLVMSLTDKFL